MKKQMNHSPIESDSRPQNHAFDTVEDTDRSAEQQLGKLECAQAQALSYVLEEEGSSSNVASLSDLNEKQERVYYDSSVGKSDTDPTARRRFAIVEDTDQTAEQKLGKLENAQAQALSYVLEEEGSSSNVASISDLKEKQASVYDDSSVGKSDTNRTPRRREQELSNSPITRQQNPALQAGRDFAVALALMPFDSISGENLPSLMSSPEDEKDYTIITSAHRLPPCGIASNGKKDDKFIKNVPALSSTQPTFQRRITLEMLEKDAESGTQQSRTQNSRIDATGDVLCSEKSVGSRGGTSSAVCVRRMPANLPLLGKESPRMMESSSSLPMRSPNITTTGRTTTFQKRITLEMLEKDAKSGKLQSRTQYARFDAKGDVLVSDKHVGSRGGTSSAACVRRMPANLASLGKESPPRHYPEQFMVESRSGLPMLSPNITATGGRTTNTVIFEEPSTASDHVIKATDTTATTEDPERPKATDTTAMTEDPERPREPTNESEGEEVEEKESRNVRFKLLFGTLLVVVAGLIVGLVLAMVEKPTGAYPDPSETTPANETAVPISTLDTNTVLAVVPDTICMDRFPGAGWSKLCTAEDTMENGGGACDLVAQAFLDQVPMADIAIQNSGSCVSDIAKGDFTIKDGMELLPKTHTLVMLEMTGQAVVLLLEQALSGVWGGSKCGGYSYSGTYPYSAGLRYRVNATAKYMHRVTNVEVNERLDQTSWRSIEWDEVYTVVANSYIASGGDGYWVFARVPKELVINTGKDATETFAEYASEHTILFDPSEDEYSTQEFIPPV